MADESQQFGAFSILLTIVRRGVQGVQKGGAFSKLSFDCFHSARKISVLPPDLIQFNDEHLFVNIPPK